jgi:hypothetical protein
MMDQKKLNDVLVDLLTEIERHQAKPISAREVVVPLLVPATDGRQILRGLQKLIPNSCTMYEDRNVLAVGKVTVYVDPKAHENPVNLRGNTALMYVVSDELEATKYGKEILMSTMQLSLTTARMSGLRGAIVRY